MRVHADARRRCYIHPHRETELTCTRCKTSYCAECLGEPDETGSRLCENCQREVEAAEAARLTFKERMVLRLHSLARGLVVAAVLIALLGGIFYFFRNSFDRPITPEEMARFRYAISGGFETDEGVNLNSTVVGAKIVSATSEASGFPAKQVINEFTGAGVPAWRSTSASFPQDITVEFANPSAPQKVILQNNPNEPAETYPRDFEILVSTEGPDQGFASVGRFVAQPNAEIQRFEFPPVQARWVRLRILSNYGSTDYTSLDEFGVYLIPNNPLQATRPPASPTP